MRTKLLSCLVMLLSSIGVMAQKVPVTGVVSDQLGPLVGVSVYEKGTTNGVITDFDGKFSLSVDSKAILVFSSIGYKTQEVTVGNQTNFTISMVEDHEFLEEAVAVVTVQ